MKICGIIPARFGSTRFPGKPLVNIQGEPMIIKVARKVSTCNSIVDFAVATDHEGIADVVEKAGFKAIMTSHHHQSGTDRCAEAAMHFPDADAIINIQGDEPFIHSEHIDKIAQLLQNGAPIATLVKAMNHIELKNNPHIVKAVTDKEGKALYFSRSPIPFSQNEGQFLKHIGIYGFQKNILMQLTALSPSSLELSENLEQLRWLENGYSIITDFTDIEQLSIDTPEDLLKI